MPTIIYVILLIFLVVVLFLSSEIKFIFLYKKDFRILLQFGFFKFDLTKNKTPKRTSVTNQAEKKATGTNVPSRFARNFIRAVLHLEKRARFKIVRLRLIVGGKNAVETAFLYTLYTRGISFLIEALSNHFTLDFSPRNSTVYAKADFVAQKTSLDLKVILRFSVYSLFSMGKYLFKELYPKKYMEKSYGKYKAK